MANLELNLVVRANADGTLSVLNGVGGSLTRLGQNAQTSNQQLRELERQTQLVASGLRTMAGIAATALGGFSASKIIDEIGSFESKMISVKALTMANAQEMAVMTKQARELGATTSFSAQQAAEAQGVLASAGLKSNEILQATPGVLQLAAAGALDLAKAADIATGVMSGMGLSLDNLPHINDVLVKVAADTKTSVSDMGDALAVSAPIAKTFSISLEDLSGAMGTLAQNNIKGSEAGNNFKAMLAALGSETADKTELLAAHGLAYKDIDVQARGLIPVLQTLGAVNLSGSEAIKLFGTDAAAAGLALAGSASEVDKLSKALKESEGAAGKMSAILSQGLDKEIDAFYGSVSEAILQLGDSGLKGALSGIVTEATGVISVYSGVIDKFAESNKLSATQKDTLVSLADGLKSVAAMAAGIAIVATAIKGLEIATIAWNAALALNPIVAGAVVLGAVGGLIYKQTQDVQAKREQAQAERTATYQKNSPANAAFVSQYQGESVSAFSGFNAGLKQPIIGLKTLEEQGIRTFKSVASEASKSAGTMTASSSTAIAATKAHAAEKTKAITEETELQKKLTNILEGKYKQEIINGALKHNVPPNLMLAIAQQESASGDNMKKSWANAHGLMQIIPSTAAGLAKDMGVSMNMVLHDVKTNAEAAALLVKQNMGRLKEYGKDTVDNIAGTYNAGFANLKKYNFDAVQFPASKNKNSLFVQTKPYMQDVEEMFNALEKISGVDSFKVIEQDTKKAGEAATVAAQKQDAMYQQLIADANEYAALRAVVDQSNSLIVFAEQLKLAGLTTDEIKKQVDLQIALDNAVAAHPNQDPTVVKTLAVQSIDNNAKLDGLTSAGISKDQNSTMQDYEKYLDSIVGKTNELKDTNQATFDGALGGINLLVGAFGELGKVISIAVDRQAALSDESKRVAQTTFPTRSGEEYAKSLSKNATLAKKQVELNKESINDTLSGTRQVIGATAEMFDKKSSAYKALHTLEQGIAVAQMAMQAAQLAQTIAGIAPKVAGGVAALVEQGGWVGFAGAAAFLALMAGLGFSGGGSGSSVSVSQQRQESAGTGTVLGDKTAKSDSINKSISILEENSSISLPVYHKMLDALIAIKDGFAQLSNQIVREFNVKDPGSLSAGMVGGSFLGNGLGMAISPFGSNKKLVDYGYSFTPDQSLGDIRGGKELGVQFYNDIKKSTTFLSFSISSSMKRVSEEASDPIKKQFTDIFLSAIETLEAVGESFDIDKSVIDQKINDFKITIPDISLKDLKGEEITAMINAIFSSALDSLSGVVLGGISIEQYQNAGEGLLETAVRVSTGLMSLRGNFDKLGISGSLAGQGVNEVIAFSESLIHFSGGLDKLSDRFNNFFDRFYSDAEKTAYGASSLTKNVEALGLSFPATRQGWRDMVNAELALGKDRAKEASKLLALTDVADTYYTGLDSIAKEATDAADKMAQAAENLKNILDDVDRQLADFGRSDVQKGIAKINDGIKKMIDDAAKELGTIPNIEQLRSKQLEAYALSINSGLDKALNVSPVTAIIDEWKKNTQSINDLFSAGLLTSQQAESYWSGLNKMASDKMAALVKAVSDPINKEFKASSGGNVIGTINDTMLEQLKTVNESLKNGVLSIDEAAGLSAKVVAIAANKVKDAFKGVNDAFAEIGQTDYQKQITAIKANLKTNNDLARTQLAADGGRNASDANFSKFDGQIDRNTAVAVTQGQAVFKPLLDEFKAIGQTDFTKSANDIKQWREDMLKSADDMALVWGVSSDVAISRINAIGDARDKQLRKEGDDIMKANAVNNSRMGDTDFAKQLWTMRDNYISTITAAANAGKSYEDLLAIAATGAREAGSALNKAQEDIAKSFKTIYKTISDKRNELSDAIYTAEGGKDLDGIQKQRALSDLQSSDYDTQMAALTTLQGLAKSKYDTEIANATKINDYLKGLAQGALSPLSTREKRDEARKDYEKNLAGAQTGDQKSIDNLGSSFDAYLTQAKDLSSTKAEYTAIFNKGRADIGKLAPESTKDLVSKAQIQQVAELKELQKQLDKIETGRRSAERDENQKLIAAFNKVGADFIAAIEAISFDTFKEKKAVLFDLSALIVTESAKAEMERFKGSVIGLLQSGTLTEADAATVAASSKQIVIDLAGLITSQKITNEQAGVILNSSNAVLTHFSDLVTAQKIDKGAAVGLYTSQLGIFSNLAEIVSLNLITGDKATQIYTAQEGLLDALSMLIIKNTVSPAVGVDLLESQNGLVKTLIKSLKDNTISTASFNGIYGAQSTLIATLIHSIQKGEIKAADTSKILGAITQFSNSVSSSIASMKLSPADSQLFSNATSSMSKVMSSAIASKKFSADDLGILALGLSGYAKNPADVLKALNFSQTNLDTLNTALTAAAGNPAEVFRLLGFSEEDKKRLGLGLTDLSTNTKDTLAVIKPEDAAIAEIHTGVGRMAKNIHDGVADVTWLKPAGDLVITGVNTMAGNISGGLSDIGIDNSGIHSAISSLMAGVVSQIASASAQASSIIANAQASVKPTLTHDPVTAFNAAYQAGDYASAAAIGHNAGYSNEQIASYANQQYGAGKQEVIDYMRSNGYANGGIANSPSIFGEAGPEAAVPLPDGRSIPVAFKNNGNNNAENAEALKAVAKQVEELKTELSKQAAENLRLQAEMARNLRKLSNYADQDNTLGAPPARAVV